MFPGGGYGIGVTVTELEPFTPPTQSPPGAVERPCRLHELLPSARMTDDELAREIQRATEAEALIAAYKAERIVELAGRRPARPAGPVDGEPDAAAVDEFFVDELAVILNCSRANATRAYEHATTLIGRLPGAWAALADGRLDWPRARALAEELGRPADRTDPRIVAEVEAAVLPRAMSLSVRGLKEAARTELVARDSAAAELRRQLAKKAVDVRVRPGADGMAELVSGHTAPRAAAMFDAIDQYAWMAKRDGDPRPIGVIRSEVHEQLVLRPWELRRPAVTARLDVLAPLSALHATVSARGEAAPVGAVNGMPITAAHLKHLLADLDALGVRAPEGGELNVALVDDDGRLRATVTRWELERLARRGCPDHPPTGEGAGCGCPVLDPPPAVDRYRPGPALRRFVSTRDRTCRHPGCHNRAGWADHDHVLPHAQGGRTACDNLCCLCRRHHRLKTLARGWRFVMQPDGTLRVTTPSGVTRTTRPPGLDPPPENGPRTRPLGTLELIRRGGAELLESYDPEDPAPF